MLQQHALQFERTDAIVRRLEHIVRAANEGEITVVINEDHVTAAIDLAFRARELAVVGLVALHQAGRALIAEHQRHFAFLGRIAVGIDDADAVARHRPPHRADLQRLLRRIADHRGGLGLAVAVANGEAPCALHLIDDLGIEWLAGAADFA